MEVSFFYLYLIFYKKLFAVPVIIIKFARCFRIRAVSFPYRICFVE